MALLANIFILGFMLVLNVYADSPKEMFKKAMMESPEIHKCIESTGFNPENMKSNDITPEKLCFFKCMMQEKGVIKDNGEVDPSAVDDTQMPIPDDKKEEIKKCVADAEKIEACEDVQKLIDCLHH